jgi:branched-chain amino acid transport system ATP-binding protein
MLAIRQLEAGSGRNIELKGIDLDVAAGRITVLVGANGAGKTTLLRVISGIHKRCSGSICLDGREIMGMDAADRLALGISQVPEGRQVFASLSVHDNLLLGAYRRAVDRAASLDRMYSLFPMLAANRSRPAGLLSGGQQQMLAVARALMSAPRALLFDEPSMGLSPRLTAEVFALIDSLRSADVGILLVEQNASAALQLADRAAVIELGQIVLEGSGEALLQNTKVQEAYLGI